MTIINKENVEDIKLNKQSYENLRNYFDTVGIDFSNNINLYQDTHNRVNLNGNYESSFGDEDNHDYHRHEFMDGIKTHLYKHFNKICFDLRNNEKYSKQEKDDVENETRQSYQEVEKLLGIDSDDWGLSDVDYYRGEAWRSLLKYEKENNIIR